MKQCVGQPMSLRRAMRSRALGGKGPSVECFDGVEASPPGTSARRAWCWSSRNACSTSDFEGSASSSRTSSSSSSLNTANICQATELAFYRRLCNNSSKSRSSQEEKNNSKNSICFCIFAFLFPCLLQVELTQLIDWGDPVRLQKRLDFAGFRQRTNPNIVPASSTDREQKKKDEMKQWRAACVTKYWVIDAIARTACHCFMPNAISSRLFSFVWP